MRRHLWFRVFSLICGLWLVAGVAEPAALHSCPMHDAVGGGHHHGGAAGVNHHAAVPASSHGQHRAAVCSCLGDCCAGVVAAIPDAAPIRTVAVLARRSRALPSSSSGFRPPAIAYARPPSIGPPHSTV